MSRAAREQIRKRRWMAVTLVIVTGALVMLPTGIALTSAGGHHPTHSRGLVQRRPSVLHAPELLSAAGAQLGRQLRLPDCTTRPSPSQPAITA